MYKAILRAAAFVLTALLLAASVALADMKRGDRSGEVSDLQQLLFETGWLFELPDGVFGKNTEAAVREFEAYAGLPVDGIADDQMICELAASLEKLNRDNGVVSDYFGKNVVGYFTGAPDEGYAEEDGGMKFAECCIQSTEVDGSSHTDYCEAHHTLHVKTYRMLQSNNAESARLASDMWYDEVNNLYEQWAMLLPEEEQGGILANRATFLASVEAQRMAGNAGEKADALVVRAENGICQTLRNQAAWLCSTIWEQQNGGPVSDDDEAVLLNAAVIVDGNRIYYAGDIEGEGQGIYVMNSDGSDRRRLSDIRASLKAVSNGNLLVWHYDDDGSGALEILRTDGTLETVSHSNCHAIAGGGRFYFGASSIQEDGSDHQWLMTSDPEYHDEFYPMEVVDGYLYFIDANGENKAGYTEGDMLPSGEVMLCRLNIESGNISVLSEAGTHYLGVEDGMLYYTREDFDIYDYQSGSTLTAGVDEGLYSMNLEALAETMIAEFSDDLLVFEYYMCLQDGVVYGEFSDYNPDDAVYKVVRRRINGEELPAIDFSNKEIGILGVEDGMLYGIRRDVIEDSEHYIYDEYLVMYDLYGGMLTEVAIEENETLTYAELRPRIAVKNGRVYYVVQDETNGAEALKSVSLNGDDVRTLVKSGPLY